MKKITMLAIFLVVIVGSLNAEILRVNNTPTAYAPYSSIDAAVTAATAGDTILVESGTYSNFTVDKSLTILGLGYNATNWNNSIAYIDGAVSILGGSDGTVISGFLFDGYINIHSNNSLILIENCKNFQIFFNTVTDITVRRCLDVELIILSTSAQNVKCYNNKINALSNPGGEVFIFNNIIRGNGEHTIRNTYAYNNIFYDINFSINPSTDIDNIFQYNVCAGNFLSPYLNNILDVNMSTQFTSNFELAFDSVAIGAGMNGEDCGMYGGVTPFTPGGTPWQIPTITEFEVAESENSINVQIGAKNNPSPTNSAPETNSKRD